MTGKPGMLQSMGLQIVAYNWETNQQVRTNYFILYVNFDHCSLSSFSVVLHTQVKRVHLLIKLRFPKRKPLHISGSQSSSFFLSPCYHHPSAHSSIQYTLQILPALGTTYTEVSLSSHISGNIFYEVSRNHQSACIPLFFFSQRLSSC